ERAEGLALGRLPGRRQRAHRSPVERAVERDDAGPAGRLAGVFERRLDRLGAGVAEERLRAAEALRKALRERGHRLSPVEVRRVPGGVELLAGGGEGRGVAVAEPDDSDPRDEVEVALPGVGDEPRALAGDEGDILPGVGREDRSAQRGGHARTAVSPISAFTPSLAAVTAARSLGTIPPSSSPASRRSSAVPAAIDGTTEPSSSRPGTSVTKRIFSAPSPLASAHAASSPFTFSGPA